MKFKVVLIVCLIVFMTLPSIGQITAEWEMLPKSDGEDLNVPYDKTEITVNDFKISIGLPVILRYREIDANKVPTLILGNSLSYSSKHLNVNNWPSYSIDQQQNWQINLINEYDHLMSFGYTGTLTKIISAKWSLTGIAGFTYAAIDPKVYRMQDLGYLGGFEATHQWESGWSMGFGFFYGRLTGQAQLLPLIVLRKQTRRSTLDINVPSQIGYWYHINQKVSLGFQAQLGGDTYNFIGVKADQYDENGQFLSSGNEIGLAYSAVTLGPELQVLFARNITLTVRTGLVASRRYQYWVSERNEVLRYQESADFEALTGHNYSGEAVEFPMKSTGYIKISVGFGF